ncbi:MAG: response regulator [Gammaproteobacteria bacterium]|jgi:DNA-binding NtrC family response regulator|nr:response regulator [Gammaproteobacteria bacterium]MBT4605841.1 response regulator [Thiotrichales bacterium]MBT3968416.1 response regulator [Gammaproteobacteria bacterium]MBT4081245.1 response regulator [Gammaproteobacteria bacterium]MBT4811239.1 response regulator [Thiotrichales bacterium]
MRDKETDRERSILMVDDDPLLLEVVSEELADRGYQVITISRPETVMEYLDTALVDLMLLDLKMPLMDGITLLKEIEKQHAELPVIILTGHGDVGSASESMRHGAIGYLQKPILMEKLVTEVDEAISKYGTAEERQNQKPSEHKKDADVIQQLKGILCGHSTANQGEQGLLPLMGVDEYHRQVILQHQHSMTETELARRLCFSRDKLWRIRKRLGIPRK